MKNVDALSNSKDKGDKAEDTSVNVKYGQTTLNGNAVNQDKVQKTIKKKRNL